MTCGASRCRAWQSDLSSCLALGLLRALSLVRQGCPAKQPQYQAAAHPVKCHNSYPVHRVFVHTDQVWLAERLEHPVGQIHRHNLQQMPPSSRYDRRGARSTQGWLEPGALAALLAAQPAAAAVLTAVWALTLAPWTLCVPSSLKEGALQHRGLSMLMDLHPEA